MISSQDLRNRYEKFYDAMRLYLWPYDILETLGNVEVNIYTAFLDMETLTREFNKLKSSIREVIEEDEYLADACNDIEELINEENELEDFAANNYYTISRVDEKNQEKDKSLRTTDKEEDDDSEDLEGGISYENKEGGI